MHVSLRTALSLIALCAAAGASVWVATRIVDIVEHRNLASVETALQNAGFGWADAETDGTLVRLTGTAPDETARFRALTAAGTAVNPQNLRDRMEIAEAGTDDAPDLTLEIHRRGSQATIFGLVPERAPGAPVFADRLAGLAPDLTVSDLLSATAYPAPESWSLLTDMALIAVNALENVRVEVTPGAVRVSGLAPDQETAADLRGDLQAAAPEGVVLSVDLETPRPVAAPFLTRLAVTPAGARFDACVASTPEGRDRILAAARGAGLVDDGSCVVAIGAPAPTWDSVAADAITVLAQLGSGTVLVSDLTVALTPGEDVAPDQILRAAARLERALPPAYRLAMPDGAGNATVDGADEVSFTATRSPEGVTILRGSAGTPEAREIVESFAASRLLGNALHISLRPSVNVPEGWSVKILAGLDAFAELDEGRLRITPGSLTLRGASGNPRLSAMLAGRLSETLGPTVPVTLDIRYEEALDPIASQPTPEECLARIEDIQSRTKITFAPGSTELDGDARRIVDRIADVLNECSDVEMEIAGHTDSQGRAEMNRTLSEERASAVLEALVAERVLTSSLTATGYGETRPVADNDTAEGREANRRIEFNLRYPLQGPPPPEVEDASTESVEEDLADGQE